MLEKLTPQGGDEAFVKFAEETYIGFLNADDFFNDRVIFSPG